MNRGTHAFVSGVGGAAIYYVGCRLLGVRPTWGEGLLVRGGCAVLGVSADLFEPATSPYHRGFFHSVAFNGVVALGIGLVCENPQIPAKTKLVVGALGLGYISHPLLDSTTPMGIPLI